MTLQSSEERGDYAMSDLDKTWRFLSSHQLKLLSANQPTQEWNRGAVTLLLSSRYDEVARTW
jgi:hypothetical protein